MSPVPGNTFAYVALAVFVPVSALVFAHMRLSRAVATVFLGGVLFLPEKTGFDLPVLPFIDKYALITLCALAGVAMSGRGHAIRRAARGTPGLLMALVGVSLVGTFVSNRDPLYFGALTAPVVLPGHSAREFISIALQSALYVVVPFLLGRAVFRTAADLEDLLRAMAVAALVYSVFLLVELRLSPQLHRWIYGFHQHQFQQSLRGGGYRPMVFMRHGIAAALLAMSGLAAACALARARRPIAGLSARWVAVYLGVVVLACKSVAAAVYGLLAVLLLVTVKPRHQFRAVALLGLVTLAYPIMRVTTIFPRVELVDFAARFDQNRAQSLEFRFDSETKLVAKAIERPTFGWGQFGRSRIYDQDGRDLVITDGQWIIWLGCWGVLGLVAHAGFFVVALRAAHRMRRLTHPALAPLRAMIAGLAIIVAVHFLDLLPNSLFYHLSLLYAGAIVGVVERVRRTP
jgi:hypothetical protein